MPPTREQEIQPDTDLLLRPLNQWPKYDGYRPLRRDEKQIRLLRIWRKDEPKEIHISIEHARLNHNIQYEALSYCWGPPAKQKPVYVDGEQVLVRNTLWNFLDSLCRHSQDLPVWLDAICIDQQDDGERNWQVEMMGDIYSQAVRTIAWLGDADDESDYTLTFLESQHTLEIRECGHFLTMQKRASEGAWQLMQRSYWRRLWVVQELGLAKQIIVLCGSRRVDFETLASAVNLTGGHEALKPLVDMRQQLWKRQEEVSRIVRTTYLPSKTMFEVMLQFKDFLCGEPRDRVFALRNMSTDRKNLPVDYTRGLGDLLFDVVQSFLQSSIDHNEVDNLAPMASKIGETPVILSQLRTLLESSRLSFKEILNSLHGEKESICLLVSHYQVAPLSHYQVTFLKTTFPESYLWSTPASSNRLPYISSLWSKLATESHHHLLEKLDANHSAHWGRSLSNNYSRDSFRLSLWTTPSWRAVDHDQRIVVNFGNSEPVIIGAADFRSCVKESELLWVVLVWAREIQACRKLWRQYGNPCVVLHYSRVAVLALSANDLDPWDFQNVLREYRSCHPLQPFCTCKVDGAANKGILRDLQHEVSEEQQRCPLINVNDLEDFLSTDSWPDPGH